MDIGGRPGCPGPRSGSPPIAAVGLYLALSAFTVARADGPPAGRPEAIELTRCRVEFSRSSLLGAAQPGVIKECTVRAGDRVVEGQIIGRLRDDDVVADLELRRVTGETSLYIELAEARRALADTKLMRAKGILKRGYLSDADLNSAECEANLARLDVDTTKLQNAMARIQIRQAEALLRFREFASPHAGVVSEILKTPGEAVTQLTPVFRIVDDQRMRVIGQLDIVDAWRVRVGHPVRVWPTIPGVQLPVEKEMFEGRVIQVDGQIDSITQTCRIVVEVENRANMLRSGLEARMEIDLIPDPSPSSEPRKASEGARPKKAGVVQQSGMKD
jgi:RND family efflux transporter MFP subunit